MRDTRDESLLVREWRRAGAPGWHTTNTLSLDIARSLSPARPDRRYRFALAHRRVGRRDGGLVRDDAEEAVQDTFIRVHRALPKYEEREAFEPWLFRILANRCRTAGGRAGWPARHNEMSNTEYSSVAIPAAYQQCAPNQPKHLCDYVYTFAAKVSADC